MMMARKDAKGNRITQTLWLSGIIIGGLFLLSFLPEFSIGKFEFKKIDILSDLHPDPPPETLAISDSIFESHVSHIDSIFEDGSITQIEDFSDDEKNLKHFYYAFKNADKRQVRIAFFGDSFIEGDIISATLRDTLQMVAGGRGVGFVPLASEVSGFRKSLNHKYSGWDTYTLLNGNTSIPIGISGYTYIPRQDNMVTFKPGKIPFQENFRKIKVFYQTKGTAFIKSQINEEPEVSHHLDINDGINQLEITHNDIKSITLRVTPDSVTLFGANFDNNYGIYVDNFSLRRNSGIALSKLSPEILKQFNKFLDYKLIILQYGLNVASENDSTNYYWYTRRMIKIITDLKEIFPQASFILLSVSDRSTNKDGKIVTMEAIPKMRNMQREIARKSGIAFWDLFEAMGGRNSIINFTEAKPPLAAKDYTHLTHLGGNKIGRKLADALLHEIYKHEKKSNIP